LLDRQHYELAFWRAAHRDINYRRFFDVNELICLRVEEPAVFDATHRTVLRFVAEGLVDGLRIDHIDGLLEPGRYPTPVIERRLTLSDAIAAEFSRPIRITYRRSFLGKPRIDCYITVAERDKRLRVLRPKPSQRRTTSKPLDTAATSLAAGPPTWFSVPPALDKWRLQA